MTIYVLIGQAGMYSDYHMWLVSTLSDKEKAYKIRDILNTASDDCSKYKHRPELKDLDSWKLLNDLDISGNVSSYELPSYHVESFELDKIPKTFLLSPLYKSINKGENNAN